MVDLDMSIVQYNSCVSVLFIGYSMFASSWSSVIETDFVPVLMQVPSNLIVSKIQYPGLYICAAVAFWGVVSACTAAVNSFGSLVACRFMLGFIEVYFTAFENPE